MNLEIYAKAPAFDQSEIFFTSIENLVPQMKDDSQVEMNTFYILCVRSSYLDSRSVFQLLYHSSFP